MEAVEKRFGGRHGSTFHRISAYTARETKASAQALNLVPHFTPVASPQSSGMSKAFVKILKRDYTHLAFPTLTST